MSQHKSTLRRSLRSALRHKVLADNLLDQIVAVQDAHNSAIAKIAADSAVALDVNYVSTNAITAFEFDAVAVGQHKSDMRKTLRSALAHKRLADEIIDAVEELQATHNALMAKLDAEAGTLNDGDYASVLGITAIDLDGDGTIAQHKAPLRKSMQKAVAHSRLGDQILDAMATLQTQMNAAQVILDTNSIAVGALTVTAIDPDAI